MFTQKKKYLKDKEKYKNLRKNLVEEKNNLSNAIEILQHNISLLQIKKNNLLITLKQVEHCTICIDKITNTDNICKLDCGHIFHFNCLLTSILISDQYDKCPNCRKKYDLPSSYDIYTQLKKNNKLLQEESDILLLENHYYKVQFETTSNLYSKLNIKIHIMKDNIYNLENRNIKLNLEIEKLKGIKLTELYLENEKLRIQNDYLIKNNKK